MRYLTMVAALEAIGAAVWGLFFLWLSTTDPGIELAGSEWLTAPLICAAPLALTAPALTRLARDLSRPFARLLAGGWPFLLILIAWVPATPILVGMNGSSGPPDNLAFLLMSWTAAICAAPLLSLPSLLAMELSFRLPAPSRRRLG